MGWVKGMGKGEWVKGMESALRLSWFVRPGSGGPGTAVRALGLDLGSRRVGVAISDREGRVVTPVMTLERGRGLIVIRKFELAAKQPRLRK